MKTPAKTTESALAVKIIDSSNTPTLACAFTLKEAQKQTIALRKMIEEDGGDSFSMAYIYHPTKGMIAWVSPNGRVWMATSEEQTCKGGLVEFPKNDLTKHFSKLAA